MWHFDPYKEEVIITHPNKKKGSAYEHRFVKRMLEQGATRAIRHYGSLGITDVEWTDSDGNKHEAQLKYSAKVPRISHKERCDLEEYARARKDVSVWLIMKSYRKPESWELIE